METLEQRFQRLVQEDVEIVPYDPRWPEQFRQEKIHLLSCLPRELIKRIEHFGSTAVPGLAAKPVIDILVEVTSLHETKTRIVPQLESQGYEHFWRPTRGDDGPPFYSWFINRDKQNSMRTHHIHMVEQHFAAHWERLLFRDYLIAHSEVSLEYQNLKLAAAAAHPNDRVAYTNSKTEFIMRVTEQAKTLNKHAVVSFVDAINKHDLDGMFALMHDQHTLIDAHENKVTGTMKLKVAWNGYFELFPDYRIEMTDMLLNGHTIVVVGLASGTYRGLKTATSETSWRLPAAWKAIVVNGKLASWQVFADTKVPFEIIEMCSGC